MYRNNKFRDVVQYQSYRDIIQGQDALHNTNLPVEYVQEREELPIHPIQRERKCACENESSPL
jgi:hypothetical protein